MTHHLRVGVELGEGAVLELLLDLVRGHQRLARGGIGRKMELTATIPSGERAGDRIVAWVDARFLEFRCRIFAERRAR